MDDDALLDALYALVTADDGLERTMGLLTARFGCVAAALAYTDAVRPEADLSIGSGALDAHAQEVYREQFAADDPAPAAMASVHIGRAIATDRVFSPEFRATSRFLREYYFPMGFREALGGPIFRDNGRFGVLAVLRGPDRGPFTDGEITAFEDILPHVIRALTLRRTFFDLDRQAGTLRRALDASNRAVLTFDQTGALLHANTTARTLLARGEGLHLTRAGRLSAQDPATARRLRALFDTQPLPGEPVVMPIPAPGRTLPYLLRALGTQTATGESELVVHISDLGTRTADAPGLLGSALSLPPAGARLLAAMVEGVSLKAYAQTAGISINTVKFHLKALFAATGTSRQTDLVRLATTVLREFVHAAGEPDGTGANSKA